MSATDLKEPDKGFSISHDCVSQASYHVISDNYSTESTSATKILQIGSTDSLKGICINCENKTFCTIIKPESGVWHCKEYK